MGDPGKRENGIHRRGVPIDEPQGLNGENQVIGWGSDAIAEQIMRLDLKYVALTPGSSYRGLHDSIVNYGANTPQMIVCLHEEHTVAIAHGYAKVTEKPMAAAVHANVGLMHASMAIYDAYTDRVPMVILGATGPLDAERRRPWVDWIHTCTDQAALVRSMLKFDQQPYSVPAAVKALARCYQVTASKPCAPTYICLDVCLQEDPFDASKLEYPDPKRFGPLPPPGPDPANIEEIVSMLSKAKRPLFMLGRVNRTQKSWDERIELAEAVEAYIITDLKQGAAFPTKHRLHPSAPSIFTPPQTCELIRAADLIISFDWVDLAGTLKAAEAKVKSTKVVNVSIDSQLYNGWGQEHFDIPPTDLHVSADPNKTVTAILAAIKSAGIDAKSKEWTSISAIKRAELAPYPEVAPGKILMGQLASGLFTALDEGNQQYCMVRLPYGWRGPDLTCTMPLSSLGLDGGAGIGSGPGQTVGAALALKDSPVLAVSVLGDGDYLMGCNALWTAAHCRLPLLIVVANNRSFYNDEVHQERVAKTRGRPVENKSIGQAITDPQPDLNLVAVGLGLEGLSVRELKELPEIMKKGVKLAQQGKAVVIDVQILPDGYATALEKAR
ncbi:hypothetical protein MMC08_006645 [Hypocenomyce scalaris]|nr:hypothetical protein [Hypocenomyce scalaris]